VSSVSLHQFLVLYAWFPLAALLLFLLQIARFYERFSGKRTYYGWYVLPLVGFGMVAVRYASINQSHGDRFAALIAAISGMFLLALTVYLAQLMLRKRVT
jgi:hypothetical protein